MVIKDDQLYTPSEVAAALRVSAATVSRAIRDGKLRAFRVGGQWRLLGSEVDNFITEETNNALRASRTKGEV